MNFVSPDRLIWILIALPIIVFYILRTRLKKQPVTTLLFWDQLFDQKRQRSLWQNLRHWLSLLLQLAFLALIVGALVDPLWTGQDDSAHEVVVVLDNSASMQAVNKSGVSRFAEAKQKALDVVASLREGDQLALITAGSSVRVRMGMTDFHPAVRDAINEVEVTDGPTRVYQAIDAAERLTRNKDEHDIVVISDGCYEETSRNRDRVTRISVGQPVDNVGITAFSLRRSLVDPIGYAALIKVHNFGQDPSECRLLIELDEELVDVIPVNVAAGESWQRTIVGASAAGGLLQAEIDIDDGLEVDNVALAVLPERPKIPVVLVSEEPSLYLASVLRAIPLIELSTATEPPPAAPTGGFIVLHRIVPERMPAGSVFVIDPRSGSDQWTLGEPIEQAIVAKQDPASPLLPHVRLINVLLPGARELQMKNQSTSLLTEAGGMTVMASTVRGEDRMVVLSTDLSAGDLPLRIAFPVLMTNATNWFLGRTGELEPALRTGELAQLAAESQSADSLVWVDARGKASPATADSDSITVGPFDYVGVGQLASTDRGNDNDTSQTTDQSSKTILPARSSRSLNAQDNEGMESVSDSLGSRLLAINLCDPQESNLRPTADSPDETSSIRSSGQRSPWFYLAFLAFGLIVSEWFLFQRRIVA